MFANLVESGSHAGDVRRKSSFFLFTIAGYTALILASFVASIYAYDARLEQANLEALAEIQSPQIRIIEPAEMRPITVASNAPVKSAMTNDIITRADAIAPPSRPDLVPDSVSTVANTLATLPPNINVAFTGRDGGSPIGIPGDNRNPFGNTTNGGSIKIATPPPLPPITTKKLEPAVEHVKPPTVSRGVVNGLATYKPEPPYPQVARNARVSGSVQIQILIDEQGKVISAQALSGHALLRNAALTAARRARFTPTKLSDVPVKVQGVITYNFKLE
ncbi:MAG: energy transducer TonB [Pyrinomonadaceae bacterium MAG19_C2-C3]|nr:energy transducer TonB [Pyrinomonadaceae bacterium MAG19_C2-C3]